MMIIKFIEEVHAQWAWIDCDPERMKTGQCEMHVYETLGIKDGASNTTFDVFVADAVQWLTFFIWTVVTIGLVVSSLMLIMAGYDEKMQEKWKKWFKYSIYWLLLVIFSYTIIRVIQFLAKW